MSVVNGETKTDAGIWSACLESTTIQSVCLGYRACRMGRRFGGGHSPTKKKIVKISIFSLWSEILAAFDTNVRQYFLYPPLPTKSPFWYQGFFLFFFSLGKPNHECFGPFIGWWGGESRLIHPLGRQNMWFIIFWSRACRTMNFHLSSKNVGRSGYLLPAWSV